MGMNPSPLTSTPFSVKDILKLEQHHAFNHGFLTPDQDTPMTLQCMNSAPRRTEFYDCQEKPCVSGMQAKYNFKLDILKDNSVAEEELNEQGELVHIISKPMLIFVWRAWASTYRGPIKSQGPHWVNPLNLSKG